LSKVRALDSQTLPLDDAFGRTLARDVRVTIDVPPFDNSAMDGYAVRAEDLRAGLLSFTVTEEVRAGTVPRTIVGLGQAVFIMTGAPMPEGADTVVRREDARREGDRVAFTAYAEKANVRYTGETTRAGDLALAQGALLGPAEIAVGASHGLAELEVSLAPRVAVISTGDELLAPGDPPLPGKIYACNAQSLTGLAAAYGARVRDFGTVRDRFDTVVEVFHAAMETSDVVVSSGGVSVGEWDHVRDVIDHLCPDGHRWQVSMRPGRPLVFGARNGTLVFGLPGNPVAVMVSFYQFVRPALLAMQGRCDIAAPEVDAELLEPVAKRPGSVHFLRARLTYRDGRFLAATTGPQGSAIISSMAAANALLCIGPEKTEYRAGETVRAQILDFKPLAL
jgi:molybdopterin molybdotransferase